MIVTPFGGLSFLVNLVILGFRTIAKLTLSFVPHYPIQEPARYLLSGITSVTVIVLVFISALSILYGSIESPFSNARIIEYIAERVTTTALASSEPSAPTIPQAQP